MIRNTYCDGITSEYEQDARELDDRFLQVQLDCWIGVAADVLYSPESVRPREWRRQLIREGIRRGLLDSDPGVPRR